MLAQSSSFRGIRPSTKPGAVHLADLIWLITLLANQSILVHNLTHLDDQQTLLTEEAVELLTVPGDLVDYKDAIAESLTRGTKRNIMSETDPKAETPKE